MNPLFSIYNTHLLNAAKFAELDPHLRELKKQIYAYSYEILPFLPEKMPGIYSLTGGRQIGKTTLLKQWMQRLLNKGIAPERLYFMSGEMINDQHMLLQFIRNQLKNMPQDELNFLIIDEVTYIKEWDKAIKFAADTRLFENVIVMLSGSDLTMLQEARMTFPGRRGKAKQKDFHLYPLSFYEYLKLVDPKLLENVLEKADRISPTNLKSVYDHFHRYLCHGGFLTAINDMAASNEIEFSTLQTYSDWIRGDVLKRSKQERYLSEILEGIIKRYNSQITWPNLAADLSIDHPNTVADYCHLLESMDVLFIQQALIEDKLLGAPKKARKVIFSDPFIYHAIRAWIQPNDSPYEMQITPAIDDPILSSQLVEACVSTHFRRYYPTYYIKAEGEVDVAYIKNKTFWPIEIKWTNQLRTKDLKQISKYPNAAIYAKTKEFNNILNIPTLPLPIALLRLGDEMKL